VRTGRAKQLNALCSNKTIAIGRTVRCTLHKPSRLLQVKTVLKQRYGVLCCCLCAMMDEQSKRQRRAIASANEEQIERGFARATKFVQIVLAKENRTFDKILLEHCENLRVIRGGVRCELFVHESLCNRFGTLHGGCISTIVDVLTTCALLAMDDERSERGGGVTTDLQISCVKAAPMNTYVQIDAICKRLGRTMAFAQCEIRSFNPLLNKNDENDDDENDDDDEDRGFVVAYGSHTKFLGNTGPRL
jgi:acyl-coenzyme A thioesterase 13